MSAETSMLPQLPDKKSNSKSKPREIVPSIATVPAPLPSPPYENQSKDFKQIIMPSPTSSTMSQPRRLIMGTRTPQMLEYERQAEERAKEQERMDEERAKMQEEMVVIEREAERIAQEEYEMEQYYRAEALRHTEEVRAHQEEIRKHQERLKAHERRMRDHEASSEAFAKVIAMPARTGKEQPLPFISPVKRAGTGLNGVSMNGTAANGS